MDPQNQNVLLTKKPRTVKIIGVIITILVIIIIVAGFRLGILGALLGAGLASYILKKSNIVSPESPLVKETRGIKIGKYILLALILLAIFGTGAYIILSN
jgi:hypothetical protein